MGVQLGCSSRNQIVSVVRARVAGSRRFLFGRMGDVWRKYCRLRVRDRHVYELIREGAVIPCASLLSLSRASLRRAGTPCHLYFDLEYQTACNPGVNGDAMVDTLIYFASQHLQLCYGLSVTRRDFVDLDSSTPVKFSRHLVCHIPGGHRFRSNEHMRYACVYHLCRLVLFAIGYTT